jgi:tellurite resistance protein
VNIDTEAIRRLRDHLLSAMPAAPAEPAGSAGAAQATEPRSDAVTRRVEPFAETMYLVMMADGEPDAAERKALTAAISVLTDGQLTIADIESMLERFDAGARHAGSEARLAQLGVRLCADQDDRETAFSLGAVVALADDRVDVRENQALQWIRQYYGISDRRMAAILESIG